MESVMWHEARQVPSWLIFDVGQKMWPFTAKSQSNTKGDDYRKKRFRELWKTLVPPSGEADTWQGEILRIVGNAEDEANRNGFVNWVDEDDRDIDLFVERLCEGSTFDHASKDRIRAIAKKIKQAGHDVEESSPNEEEWDFMHFRAVDWCDAHPVPIPMRDEGGYVGRF